MNEQGKQYGSRPRVLNAVEQAVRAPGKTRAPRAERADWWPVVGARW